MKAVTGRITSSKPISLKSAAVALSRFVATDAQTASSSQAVSAYLKRASAAFDELLQFHKDLKSSKRHGSAKKRNAAEMFDDGSRLTASEGGVVNAAHGDGRGRRDEKMREMVVVEDGLGNFSDSSKGKKKSGVGKKQAANEVFDVGRGGAVDASFYEGRKDGKKVRRDGKEAKDRAAVVVDGEKYEKRVKAEVENGFVDRSDSARKKKKKRRLED
ncbi:hypothetical protein ACLOJK_016579 [Asimina triloba]